MEHRETASQRRKGRKADLGGEVVKTGDKRDQTLEGISFSSNCRKRGKTLGTKDQKLQRQTPPGACR